MGYKTKRKKVVGTDITNSTTQHSNGKIRHTRSTKTGNSTISTSRNSNGSMRVTKTQRSNGYTYRSQKTYGTTSRRRSRSSGGGEIGILGFFGILLLGGLLWLNETFPVFTHYLLYFLVGIFALGVIAWIIWTIWIFRYLILGIGFLIGTFYFWNKFL